MTGRIISGPRLIAALVLLVLAAALFVRMRPPAAEVEFGAVSRGPMTVTIDDLAETRVRDLYTLSAPVTGELLRVPLKPGARVLAGRTLLARIRPIAPGPLDAREFAAAEASVRVATARLESAQAEARATRAAMVLVERRLSRVTALRTRGFVAQAALDEARAASEGARAAHSAARGSEAAARQAINAARALLILPGSGSAGRGIVEVRAPVSGAVLTVPQESMRVVAAGTPLVTIGDPASLELVTDLLSEDAVQVREGAAVSIEDWGGAQPLRGRVRLVEPYGFLKISALGVEEQRVNVVIELLDPHAVWSRLGHGFRATVRIATWSGPDVTRVPIGALFRSGAGWSVFRAEAGRAQLVAVRIGHRNDDWAEVLDELRAGDQVILHPGKAVADGIRVTAIR